MAELRLELRIPKVIKGSVPQKFPHCQCQPQVEFPSYPPFCPGHSSQTQGFPCPLAQIQSSSSMTHRPWEIATLTRRHFVIRNTTQERPKGRGAQGHKRWGPVWVTQGFRALSGHAPLTAWARWCVHRPRAPWAASSQLFSRLHYADRTHSVTDHESLNAVSRLTDLLGVRKVGPKASKPLISAGPAPPLKVSKGSFESPCQHELR